MKFHFVYHDGSELVIQADEARHFTGHVVLINATILTKNAGSFGVDLVPKNKTFLRLNLALNGNLLAMWPEDVDVQ